MQLHNTLTKKSEPLTPIEDNLVRIYSCGPTVYDHAHIGNLSAYIFADTLRRVIEGSGYKTNQVMNYTDIDDKTIAKSKHKYPNEDPKVALAKLTDHFIELFKSDMGKIGNDLESVTFVRATDFIPKITKLIVDLHHKGFAYIADDGIYFSIDAYRKSGKTYGQLSDITLDSTSKQRIQNDEYDKKTAHDFALWKKQKQDDPAWDFKLDGVNMPGRPGWHIECSVMSQGELGLPFDVHTGGIDLIFPHHENEIAQSTALQDSPIMASIFAHNNHILVDGKKMAKSANNFYTLDDIASKNIDPLAFRLMVLQAHYRNQVHFSWDNLKMAENRLKRWQNASVLRYQVLPTGDEDTGELLVMARHNIKKALQNDLDTPKALAIAEESFTAVEAGVPNGADDAFDKLLDELDASLGLRLKSLADISPDQSKLLSRRQIARDNNDFKTSDNLRDELVKDGVEVRDTPNGQIWSRV